MISGVPISVELHVGMLIFSVIGMILPIILCRTGWLSVEKCSTGFGWLMWVLWIGYNIYYFYPSNFDWQKSLPLHVCDLLGPISAVALLTSRRLVRSLLFFSAIPFALQAIATPTGNQDPATLRFWLYWLLHAGILSASMFDFFVRDYSPKIRDLGNAIVVDLCYAAAIVPLDVAFSWNYGYLGPSKPDTTTALDFLGPWPARIVSIIAVAVLLQTMMLALSRIKMLSKRNLLE